MRSWQVSSSCGVILTLWLTAMAGAAASDLSGVWRGEKLTLELTRDAAGYAGAIRMGDRSFPLTASEAGGGITGAFSASGSSFNFTATAEGDTMTLTSDNARHVLKRAVNPLARPAAPGAGNPLVRPQPARPPAAGANANVLRFRRFSINDDRGMIGGEAFSFLAPVDWKVEGQMAWRMHPALPAYMLTRVSNPKGLEQVEVFPQMPFVDGIREGAARAAAIAGPEAVRAAVAPWPEGANYGGNEIRRVVNDPVAFIEQFVLPRCRQNVRFNIVKREPLPKLAEAAIAAAAREPGIDKNAAAARVRIEYREAGQDVEEDVYVVLYYANSPQMQSTFWGTQWCFGLRAGKGQLDSRETIFRTILDSTRVNLNWYNKYQQVVQMLIEQRLGEIRAVGELSKYIAKTNNEISDIITKSYQERQASQDRINTNFSQYIRGVDEYKVPGGEKIELPSGYKDAWYNAGKGEYIVSDNALFNPNVEVGGDWTKLEKK